jgi:hypothetical protein
MNKLYFIIFCLFLYFSHSFILLDCRYNSIHLLTLCNDGIRQCSIPITMYFLNYEPAKYFAFFLEFLVQFAHKAVPFYPTERV